MSIYSCTKQGRMKPMFFISKKLDSILAHSLFFVTNTRQASSAVHANWSVFYMPMVAEEMRKLPWGKDK